MRITITGKNLEITDYMRERVEKKMNKLDRFFRDEVDATIRLAQEKNFRNIAEITLNMNGAILRAEEISDDMYMSIDKAIDKIVRQIRRHRTKLAKRLHEEELAPAADEPLTPPVEEDPDELVRVKRFAVKPMSVEDAIAQMDMLGHSFFLFVNSETGITSVIYRRLDGKIGMLEPTNA